MSRSNSSCHTHKKKKREDETGKIAPLLKKKKLLYCLRKKIVVLSNEEVLRSFMSIDYFAWNYCLLNFRAHPQKYTMALLWAFFSNSWETGCNDMPTYQSGWDRNSWQKARAGISVCITRFDVARNLPHLSQESVIPPWILGKSLQRCQEMNKTEGVSAGGSLSCEQKQGQRACACVHDEHWR